MELSIIAPMYNEEANISSTVEKISEAMNAFGKDWEFIMVNDGSTDDTEKNALKIAEENKNVRVVSYFPNRGRGKALRTGFSAAQGKYVVSIDFDLSYSADHILKLYNALLDNPVYDMVLGSCYMKDGQTIGVPPFRLFISKMANMIVGNAIEGNFKTVTCVLRGYKKQVLDSLYLTSDDKEIHLEILSKAVALGFKVLEIPATLTSRKKGTSKFRFKKQSISHLLFSLFEKPGFLFLIAGLISFLSGIAEGLYITWLRFQGMLNPGRPLMYLAILSVIFGIQMISFGFVATQINMLKKELYIIQKEILVSKKELNNDTDTKR